MRHLEIRDLWLQKEIREGKVVVHKVLGTENQADLMTKILTLKEIEDRLKRMSIQMRLNDVQQVAVVSEVRMCEVGMCDNGGGVGPPPISPFGGGQGGNISAFGLKERIFSN